MAQNSESRDESHNNQENPLSSIVQNMALAHEMVMDETFRIDEEPADSLTGQVKQIVHRAFWDNIEEELAKEPPNYAPALKLLGELKETLLSVLFDHSVKLREQINNVLDLQLIMQQSQHGAVDIQGYAAYIIDVMASLCSPARDEEIEKLKSVEGMVPLFREIFRVLDLMQVDKANFCLTQIRPHLIQQSVEYEQNKFREYLNGNPNGLLSTRMWLKRGMDDLKTTQDEQTDNNCERQSNSEMHCNATTTVKPTVPELSEVVKYSYIGILLGEGDFPFPETLLMDQLRLADMRQSIQCLLRAASVLVVTLNMVGRDLAADSEYKKTLKENVYILLKTAPARQLQNAFANISEQVVKETSSFISRRGLQSLDQENVTNLRLQIAKMADQNHTICQLIRKRVKGFLINQIVQKEASPSTTTLPTALTEVEPELRELTKQFIHIVSHNFAVFRPFYEKEIQGLT